MWKQPKAISTEASTFGYAFKLISRLMYLTGSSLYENQTPTFWTKCYFYAIYVFFNVSVFFSFLTVWTEPDINRKIQAVTMFLIAFSGSYKLHCVWLMKNRQWKIANTAIDNIAAMRDGNSLEMDTYEEYGKSATFIAKFVFFSYTTAVTSFVLYPLFTKRKYEVPLHFTIPGVAYKQHPGYELTFLWSTYLISYSAVIIGSFDISFFLFCIYVASRLDLCVKYSAQLGDKTGEFNTDAKQKELIKKIAKLFSASYELLQDCSILYGSSILVSTISAIGYFSSSLVYLISNNFPIFIFGEIFAMVIQFFLYSRYGDLILSKGEEISEAIYSSKWYELDDISLRKMVLFLLRSSQRCAGFSIGGFSILCLQSFTNFSKTCYTIAACLLNMMD